MPEIPTSELRAEHVPEPDAPMAQLREFALTFNAYRRVGGPSVLSQVYDEVREYLDRHRTPTANALRAACFYLARAVDNTNDPVESETIEGELRELVGRLRRILDRPETDHRIALRDLSRTGHELGGAEVGGLSATTSLRDILRIRIRSEVARYNAAPGTVFDGLVQPADAVRHRDGHHLATPRPLDPDRLVTAAEEAVAAGVLGFLLEGDFVTELDRDIHVDDHEELVLVLQRPVVARHD